MKQQEKLLDLLKENLSFRTSISETDDKIIELQREIISIKDKIIEINNKKIENLNKQNFQLKFISIVLAIMLITVIINYCS